MDTKLEQGFDLIRTWYHDEIRSCVDTAIKKCNDCMHDDEDTAREWLTEYVDQLIDDHQFVIYTFQAKCVCLASDCEDAYENETGETPPSVEVQACYAMRADIWAYLGARSDEWVPSDAECAS